MTKSFSFFGKAFLCFVFMAFSLPKNETVKEIKIGEQIWMSENLNSDTFRDGSPIPQAKSAEDWKRAGENKKPVWCHFNNDPSNGDKLGKLYNYYAVIDPRGLAPEGWKIPSDSDWNQLVKVLGYDAAHKLKSTADWSYGTNESGFSAVRSGSRSETGRFGVMHEAHWWSSSGYLQNTAIVFSVLYDSDIIAESDLRRESGRSVRCIKD